METVTDFIFLAPKITADSDCSHEIQRRLVLGRKSMTNLDSVLKSGDITLPTKVHLVKTMFFPVVIYGCESWTMRKAEELMLLNSGVGEDSWESLGQQGDQTSQSERKHPCMFIGRTDAKVEAPILWPPDTNNWLIGKDLDSGNDWRQE